MCSWDMCLNFDDSCISKPIQLQTFHFTTLLTLTFLQVYFPAGTYIVSAPIIDYYYTQIIGNPNCMPIIKATSSFTARWVIDGDEV